MQSYILIYLTTIFFIKVSIGNKIIETIACINSDTRNTCNLFYYFCYFTNILNIICSNLKIYGIFTWNLCYN